MSDKPQGPNRPAVPDPSIGDPPPREPPVKAARPMQDPFTEEITHHAGEGQGANRPQPDRGAARENREGGGAGGSGIQPCALTGSPGSPYGSQARPRCPAGRPWRTSARISAVSAIV